MFVHQAGVAGRDEGPSILHVEFQCIGLHGGKQAERRRDDELVLGQILVGPGEIHRDVPVVQRGVIKLHVLAQGKVLVRLAGQGQGPIVVMRV
jgi:hypothetical protein